jgi:hypothetical protein
MGLFKDSSTISFKSDKNISEIKEQIQDYLENIGMTEISDNGKIEIDSKKYNNFSCTSSIEGVLKEKNGKFFIELNYEARMTTIAWVLFIIGLFWLVGLIILIFPAMCKNEIKRKIDKNLDDIRFDFK